MVAVGAEVTTPVLFDWLACANAWSECEKKVEKTPHLNEVTRLASTLICTLNVVHKQPVGRLGIHQKILSSRPKSLRGHEGLLYI